MAITTINQSQAITISVGQQQVGTFNTSIAQDGSISAAFSITDAQTFFSTTEGATNLNTLVANILTEGQTQMNASTASSAQ